MRLHPGHRSSLAHSAGCSRKPTLARFAFSYYNKGLGDYDSARKHGVADEDTLHAIDYALAIEDAGEEPDRWLFIDPDTAGNLIEVVVMIPVEGTQIVIHTMPMRDQYRRLLGP